MYKLNPGLIYRRAFRIAAALAAGPAEPGIDRAKLAATLAKAGRPCYINLRLNGCKGYQRWTSLTL